MVTHFLRTLYWSGKSVETIEPKLLNCTGAGITIVQVRTPYCWGLMCLVTIQKLESTLYYIKIADASLTGSV